LEGRRNEGNIFTYDRNKEEDVRLSSRNTPLRVVSAGEPPSVSAHSGGLMTSQILGFVVLSVISFSCMSSEQTKDTRFHGTSKSPSELRIILTQPDQSIDGSTLVGHVLDRDSKTPLQGVRIVLRNAFIETSTSIRGDFEIKNIPPDAYRVSVESPGFEPVYFDNTLVLRNDFVEIQILLDRKPLSNSHSIWNAP